MKEPCMCGATDCARCYPQNFDHGIFLERTCSKCQNDFWLEDRFDETELCEECQANAKVRISE
jgi:PHP family Zn ribbon phosphoesterase